MPALAEAIARYHRLVEQNGFGDPAWCEELQERMRQMHLAHSGRLLSPILRPYFLTVKQADSLTRIVEQFSIVLDKALALVLASQALLNRLHMLPAEKMMAAVPVRSPHLSAACRLDALSHQNGLGLLGLDACQPSGLVYSDLLADLFLDLPIVKELKRTGYKISKPGSSKQLYQALTASWREFGGKTKPVIAVVECASAAASGASEGQLIVDLLTGQGAEVSLVSPERLEYSDGRLRAGDVSIDVVFRRILTQEILARWELSHPLLQAYRDGAVCVVNNFRSEMGRRRTLLELLSDQSFMAQFPAADRKLVASLVPWTRLVAARNVKRHDKVVDLLEYIRQDREGLLLQPNEDSQQEPSYIGAEMSQPLWERAIRSALRTPYVVQERTCPRSEPFPFFQYGELKMNQTEIVLQPQLLNGKLASFSALLRKSSAGSITNLGSAPVLIIE